MKAPRQPIVEAKASLPPCRKSSGHPWPASNASISTSATFDFITGTVVVPKGHAALINRECGATLCPMRYLGSMQGSAVHCMEASTH